MGTIATSVGARRGPGAAAVGGRRRGMRGGGSIREEDDLRDPAGSETITNSRLRGAGGSGCSLAWSKGAHSKQR